MTDTETRETEVVRINKWPVMENKLALGDTSRALSNEGGTASMKDGSTCHSMLLSGCGIAANHFAALTLTLRDRWNARYGSLAHRPLDGY